MGKHKIDCREQLAVEADDQALDLEIAEGLDSSKFSRHFRCAQTVAETRLLPRKRGRVKETEGEKNLRGGADFVFFRSGVRARVRKEILWVESIYRELREIKFLNYHSWN